MNHPSLWCFQSGSWVEVAVEQLFSTRVLMSDEISSQWWWYQGTFNRLNTRDAHVLCGCCSLTQMMAWFFLLDIYIYNAADDGGVFFFIASPSSEWFWLITAGDFSGSIITEFVTGPKTNSTAVCKYKVNGTVMSLPRSGRKHKPHLQTTKKLVRTVESQPTSTKKWCVLQRKVAVQESGPCSRRGTLKPDWICCWSFASLTSMVALVLCHGVAFLPVDLIMDQLEHSVLRPTCVSGKGMAVSG